MRYFFYLSILFLVSCKKEITEKIIPQSTTAVIVDTTKQPTTPSFDGYRVDENAINKYGAKYWYRMTPVMMDLVIQTFQTPNNVPNCYPCQKNFINAGWAQAITGDFNNDGYIDVFTWGAYPGINSSFLLWNKSTNKFEQNNLFNDKSFIPINGASKIIPCYLNGDKYVDMVMIPGDDEFAPIHIITSDGKGGYDVFKMTHENITLPNGNQVHWVPGSGDVGDLNGDGIPDLIIPANTYSLIYYGKNSAPYFNTKHDVFFAGDDLNFGIISNNGFNERCSECATNIRDFIIEDVNNDGQNDLIGLGPEEKQGNEINHQKIILNQGKGRFNNNGVINLPLYNSNTPYACGDMVMLDDKKTLIGLIHQLPPYNFSDIVAYVPQSDGTYKIDNTMFQFSSNPNTKTLADSYDRLIYYDFNGDGVKDIGYTNNQSGGEYGDYNPTTGEGNVMKLKTVFIRQGNQFVETPYYQFDTYANSLIPTLFARFH
jgi:hypothetical protein